MLSSLSEFIGHFHPVLVHLPIGILLLGLLLKGLSRKTKFDFLTQAVPLVILWGSITALVSAITGYLLSTSDDYDKTLVNWHMWMGIGVVITSSLLYAKEKNYKFPISSTVLSTCLLLLVLVTGHLGGSLTHGSDYLTGPLTRIFETDSLTQATIKPISNVQEAPVFRDVIRPILQTKCFSCHGSGKQKGGLRMDDSVAFIKGGKDGKVIEPFHADESELIRRVMLPVDDQDHMPPKERPQPTESQIALLHWWIGEGAGFNKKVKELAQPERIKPVLLALEAPEVFEKGPADIPADPVAKADDRVIEQLYKKDILVLPIARNTNYLMANLVSNTALTGEDLQLLLSLKKQLVWLKLAYTNISNQNMAAVGQFNNLTKLSLEHTSVTDEGLQPLKSLQNLQSLNLVGTKVTAQGVMQLKGLESLQSLYLYQTGMVESDWAILKAAFPKTQIERGGYVVPMTPADTSEVRP